MENNGFKFDFETQRFLKSRWDTPVGKKVHERLIACISESVEIRGILDDHVLEHPESYDPHGHPIYPKSEMLDGKFWVLTSDDLRGIHFYNEDFKGSRSLERKSLNYSRFYKCDLYKTDLSCSRFSYAYFEKCYMVESVFALSGGFHTKFLDCDMRRMSFWDSGLQNSVLNGSDLTGAYFENATISDLTVNHSTILDANLTRNWENRKMPQHHVPDLLRSFRIGYKDAEIWEKMDEFLFREHQARRKNILWPKLLKKRTINNLVAWVVSYMQSAFSGYSTKPARIIIFAIASAAIFALLYLLAGTPTKHCSLAPAISEAIYYSMTTFATLGYGDVSYSEARPYMRIISTIEAWIGAITISLFVVALSRKVFR